MSKNEANTEKKSKLSKFSGTTAQDFSTWKEHRLTPWINNEGLAEFLDETHTFYKGKPTRPDEDEGDILLRFYRLQFQVEIDEIKAKMDLVSLTPVPASSKSKSKSSPDKSPRARISTKTGDEEESDGAGDVSTVQDSVKYKSKLKQLRALKSKFDMYDKMDMPTAIQDEVLNLLQPKYSLQAEKRIKILQTNLSQYETRNNKFQSDNSRHAKLIQALKDSFGVNVWDALVASVGPTGYLHEWLKALAGHYSSAVPGSSKSSWIKDFNVLTLHKPKDKLVSFNAMSTFLEKLNKRISQYSEVFHATDDITTAAQAFDSVLRALLIDKLRNTLPSEHPVYQAFANDVMLKGENLEDGDVSAIMANFAHLLNLHESQHAQEQKDKPPAPGKRKGADADSDEPAAALVAGIPKKANTGKGRGGGKPSVGKNTTSGANDGVDVSKFTHKTKSPDGRLFWCPSKQKFMPHSEAECWTLNPHLKRPYPSRGVSHANAALNSWGSAPPPWMYGPGYYPPYPPQGQYGYHAGPPQWQDDGNQQPTEIYDQQTQPLSPQRGTQFRSAANNTLDQNLGRSQRLASSRTNAAYPVGQSGARSYRAQPVDEAAPPPPPPAGHVGPYPPSEYVEPRPRSFMGMVSDFIVDLMYLLLIHITKPQAKTATLTGPLMRAVLSTAVVNRVELRNLKAFRSVAPSHPAKVLALTDSGCTQLMSPIGVVTDDKSSGFLELRALENYAITVADDHVVYATGVGTFRQMLDDGGHLLVHDALHVPVMGCTLLSVAQLMSTNKDHLVVFSYDRCIVWNPAKDESFILAYNMDSLYVVNRNDHDRSVLGKSFCFSARKKKPLNPIPNHVFQGQVDASDFSEKQLWHHRMAHFGDKILEETSRKKLASGFPSLLFIKNKNEIIKNSCISCDLGKFHKQPIYSTKRPPAPEVNHTLHSDYSGRIAVPGVTGARLYRLIIDEYSRFVHIYLHQSSAGGGDEMISHILREEALLHKPVLFLRMDNGRELNNAAFIKWAKNKTPSIKLEFTVPYTPSEDGIAERANRTFVEATICMLQFSNLPARFWDYGMVYAVMVKNHLWNPVHDSTPYERRHGVKPSVNHFRIFGCLCFILIPKEKHVRHKYERKSDPGIFLGFNGTKHVLVYNLVKQHVEPARHVRFHENRFPGLIRSQDRLGQMKEEYFQSLEHGLSILSNDEWYAESTTQAVDITSADFVSDARSINENLTEDERELNVYETEETAIDIDTTETEDTMEPLDMVGIEVPVVDMNNEEAIDGFAYDDDEDFLDAPVDLDDLPMEGGWDIHRRIPRDNHAGWNHAQEYSDASHDLDRSASPTGDDDLPSPECYNVGNGHHMYNREWNSYISKELWEGNDPTTPVNRYQEHEARQRRKWFVNSARVNKRVAIRRHIAKQYAPQVRAQFAQTLAINTLTYMRMVMAMHCFSGDVWRAALQTSHIATPEKRVHVSELPDPPLTVKEAMSRPDWDKWDEAIKSELNSFVELDIMEDEWLSVSEMKERNIKPIGTKFVFTYKLDADGYVVRYKCRGVVLGHHQREGIDYTETYSPVVKIQSIRLLIALSLMFNLQIDQMDVSTAFLYAKIDDDNIYIKQFPYKGEEDLVTGKVKVHRLKKSLYGLHQSPRLWYEHLSEHLVKNGFTEAKSDTCVFYKLDPITRSFQVVIVYVDDLMLMTNTPLLMKELKEIFNAEFTMKDMGTAEWLLGIKFRRYENGIYLGQPTYAQETLVNAGLWDMEVNGMKVPVTPKFTTLPSSWQHDESSPLLDSADSTKFKSFLMRLSYMVQQTRPDMAYAVNTLAQYQVTARECDWNALVHLLRYLRGTWDYGLFFQRTKDPIALFTNDASHIIVDETPVGYADASYAEDQNRKSRSAFVFMFCGAAVLWYSKKQSVVALSSTEAEYYALGSAVQEALWLRNLLRELTIPMLNATIIMEDNMSTIAIASNPIQNQRVKHVDVKYHFLRDHISNGDVELVYCPTEDMIADALTKPLPAAQQTKLVSLMGLRSEMDLSGNSYIPARTGHYAWSWAKQ